MNYKLPFTAKETKPKRNEVTCCPNLQVMEQGFLILNSENWDYRLYLR